MTEYYIEKFYGEYAIKKEDTIIAVIDTGTNARKVCDLLNKQDERIRELENSKKQLKRVYNYFMDYLGDEMSGNSFSEMWDFVITDEKWD